MIREMFAYAKEHEPCVIFMDEIDAIGGRRFSEGTSADREIQRTLMEVSSDHTHLADGTGIDETQLHDLASEPDGWFRYPWTNQDYHGNQPTGYS